MGFTRFFLFSKSTRFCITRFSKFFKSTRLEFTRLSVFLQKVLGCSLLGYPLFCKKYSVWLGLVVFYTFLWKYSVKVLTYRVLSQLLGKQSIRTFQVLLWFSFRADNYVDFWRTAIIILVNVSTSLTYKWFNLESDQYSDILILRWSKNIISLYFLMWNGLTSHCRPF